MKMVYTGLYVAHMLLYLEDYELLRQSLVLATYYITENLSGVKLLINNDVTTSISHV